MAYVSRTPKVAAAFGAFSLMVALCVALLVGCSSNQTDEPKANVDFSGVRSVCELATLKSYYHNVATVNVEGTGPFAAILNTGYKRLWIEYSGVVNIGIDASQVTIGEPNDQGVVEVHVPDVQILDVNFDKESIGDPVAETGFLTNITAEEKMAGIAAAQDNMRETAEKDQSLFTQAYDRARRTIAGYVKNVGEAVGQEYTVKWV